MGEARAALQPPVTVAGARPGVRRGGGGALREPESLQVVPPTPNPGSTLTSCLRPRARIQSPRAPNSPPALLQPNWLVNNALIAHTM